MAKDSKGLCLTVRRARGILKSMQPTRWYKKKRYIIPIFLVGLFALGQSNGATPTPSPTVQGSQSAAVLYAADAVSPAVTPAIPQVVPPAVQPAQPTPATGTNLSNDNHYTNSSGNVVHSPAFSTDGSVPPGATAQCRDGTYSFSQHRRGTCSHHGGVANWL